MNDNDYFGDDCYHPQCDNQNKQIEAEKEDEYKVGYQKPPKEHQFQKGQSGNPKGRPKKSKNFKTIIQDELYGCKEFMVNGKKMRAPALTLIMRQLQSKALKGDIQAARMLFQYADKYGPDETDMFDDFLGILH